MRHCTKKSTRMTYIVVSCMFALPALFFDIIFIEAWLQKDAVGILFFGFSSVFFAVLSFLFLTITIWTHRKFNLLPDGLRVAYPFCCPRKINWSDISEVAVCHIHRSRNRSGIHVLRIAVGDAFASTEDPYGLWQMCFGFSMKYHNYVVIFDYSEELEQEFRQICPIAIKYLSA